AGLSFVVAITAPAGHHANQARTPHRRAPSHLESARQEGYRRTWVDHSWTPTPTLRPQPESLTTNGSQWPIVPVKCMSSTSRVHELRRRGLVGMNHYGLALVIQSAPERERAPGLLSRNRCRSAPSVPRLPR